MTTVWFNFCFPRLQQNPLRKKTMKEEGFILLLLQLVLLNPVCGLHRGGNTVVLNLDGDIRLGALFPIHKQGLQSSAPCGEIQKEDGIQPLEAMLFTLDQINRDTKLLPGITLGVTAIDSCDNPYFAAERSLQLVKGFIARTTNMTCTMDNDETSSDGSSEEEEEEDWPCDGGDNIVGLVGPQTSPVSVQIASLGRLFHVPQVSYLATSVALCSREKYPYFFRTVPSDVHQAKAIIELLKVFDWQYASIVHSDSEYGATGYSALKRHVSSLGKGGDICLADPITIHNDIFTPEDYKAVIDRLLENKQSKVVIVFADRVVAGRLLEAAKNHGGVENGRFVWVGSDAWASRESVTALREKVVEGAIAVQPLRRILPGFDEYFQGLFEGKNVRNPWFADYVRRYHNCSGRVDNNGTEEEDECQGPWQQSTFNHFVRDAVYVFAHALHRMHSDLCGGGNGNGIGRRLCPRFRRRVFHDLKDYLPDVSFPDVAQKTFEFYGHDRHDGPPRYSIIHFRKNTDGENEELLGGGGGGSSSSSSSPPYDWHNVATFHHNKFSEWDVAFKERYLNDKKITRCMRRPCNMSEVVVPHTKDLCCWYCRPCTAFEVKVSDYECAPCEHGKRSTGENRTGCEDIPETFLDYNNRWAQASMAFAALGIALTLVTAAVLWRYWNTPVVKACGRELSLMLLLGTFLSFTTTFAIVATPSNTNCGVMRFCIGFCYTVCYAAVATKTNRVARIFSSTTGGGGGGNGSGLNRRLGGGGGGSSPRFTSPLSSLAIVGVLVSVEVVINLIWMILEPPSTTHIVTNAGKRILVCNGVDDRFMAGLVYPFFLILCATMYAFKARKCPGGFNETRFIFFANSITCIHWIAYVPLYLVSTDPEIRAVILALSLSLSGMVQLGCLLFPRVYTVLFKPEKNTRGNVMNQGRRRKMGLGGNGKNGQSFNVPATPPNSYAFGATASEMAQQQQLPNAQSQPTFSTKSGNSSARLAANVSFGNLPPCTSVDTAAQTTTTGRSKLLWAPSPSPSHSSSAVAATIAAVAGVSPTTLRSRQWGNNGGNGSVSEDEDYLRMRSSSVCRGTQTKQRTTKIKFSVGGVEDEEESEQVKDTARVELQIQTCIDDVDEVVERLEEEEEDVEELMLVKQQQQKMLAIPSKIEKMSMVN